jgi:hypothetical protein
MDIELVPTQRLGPSIGRVEVVVFQLGVARRQEPQVPRCRLSLSGTLSATYGQGGDAEAPPSPGTYIDTFA